MEPTLLFAPKRRLVVWFLSWALLLVHSPLQAEHDSDFQEKPDRPDGIHVLDGSYVLNMGALHMNITNHGLIGSQYSLTLPYSWAPSGQWPGSSGNEYLWGAGLWVGGQITGQLGVTTGQPEREMRPGGGILDTIYESRNQQAIRPWAASEKAGWRLPDPRADDDGDGVMNEDPLTGYDEDGDGLIDEDFGHIGDQMFTANMYDKIPLVQEIYPNHLPLGLKVNLRAATFAQEDLRDIVVLDYRITNVGIQEIKDVYLGFYVDCDIQQRGQASNQPDDLAGLFQGPIRNALGAYRRIEVAWMRDGAEDDPLPGWFGTVLLNHDTHFQGYNAPPQIGVRSYQIFATNAATNQQGEPKSDADRYALMAREQIDANREDPSETGDLKFMISSGPFPTVPVGRTMNYRLAFVIGQSKQEMLAKALRITELHAGREFSLDEEALSGYGGRETKVCIGDMPPYSDGSDPMFHRRIDFMDETCTGPDPVYPYAFVNSDHLIGQPDGRRCAWVNADNCEECYRAMGRECTIENGLFFEFLDRYPWYRYPEFYTGIYGREYREPWVDYSEVPPIAPNIRVETGPKQVEVFWDDRSEHDPDYWRGVIDFESYRVWRVKEWTRAPGTSPGDRPSNYNWGMIAEYDIANFIPEEVSYSGKPLALGRNTGLEEPRYSPACLTDPRFAGLAEVMDAFVQADTSGQYKTRPPVRNAGGVVIPGREAFVPWETWPTVLDTFFDVTAREGDPEAGVVGKRGVGYYSYRDTEVADGFENLYSVVASDHEVSYDEETFTFHPAGYGIQSQPSNNFLPATPGPRGQTIEEIEKYGQNIYVYPNPATREALAEFQRQPPSRKDPTGERIMFNNLPAAQNLISIFTTSGDLVDTISHDGTTGSGFTSWNLMSRNGQEVVSGIYIYTVESDDHQFEVFRGTFVLIR